jgi:hypothetical protein
MFQFIFNNILLQEQIYHVFNYIINYSIEYLDTSDDIKELLHEVDIINLDITINRIYIVTKRKNSNSYG